MSTKIEVSNCFVKLTMNDFFSNFTFVVEVLFNLRTFSQDLAIVIELF